MIRSEKSQELFYRISCSDWQYMALAESSIDACTIAFKEILKDKNNNISFVACVDEIKNESIDRQFIYVPEILQDLGYYKLAKELSNLSDFFLDKRKNPH